MLMAKGRYLHRHALGLNDGAQAEAAIVATPTGQALALGAHKHGVVSAAHCLLHPGGDGAHEDRLKGRVGVLFVWETELAKLVAAPGVPVGVRGKGKSGVSFLWQLRNKGQQQQQQHQQQRHSHGASCSDCSTVEVASCNLCDWYSRESFDTLGRWHIGSLLAAMPKRALGATTKGKDLTKLGQQQCVVVACSHLNDLRVQVCEVEEEGACNYRLAASGTLLEPSPRTMRGATRKALSGVWPSCPYSLLPKDTTVWFASSATE